ncbi:tRNA-uridine aminocarboxypropyltransferase 1-like [Mercenaria mercenaria]|uniref:tRNA-uridine aminocarboxypropyltransferase 1-like n=1 Tax=Mercenaria mercenaria TaxID=6596 RepID=UPI00234F6213|nr:tRNA-uridine aminocarboxypropyltransferase 1-like [Mercenaria mercenaria]
MEENPFPDLKIDSSDFLDTLCGRSKCSKCERSRKYYCYNCYVPVPEIEGKVPKVKLPVKIDVIKHPSEVDGKSTAVHAAVIAPDDVTVYTYPCIPDYDKNKVVLVFPGESSVTLADLSEKWGVNSRQLTGKRKACSDNEADDSQSCNVEKLPRLENNQKFTEEQNEMHLDGKLVTEDQPQNGEDENVVNSLYTNLSAEQASEREVNHSCENNEGVVINGQSKDKAESPTTETAPGLVPTCRLERVVFIDSTWNQTKTICSDERLRGLQCIELKTRETKFWRHQKDIPNTYLSTVEAMYYFLREYHEQFIQSDYNGEYDNLLFFFIYMYKKIRTLYSGGSELKAYKERAGK